MFKLDDKIFSWIPEDKIEPEALTQIRNMAKMNIIPKWVSVMPDCHLGKGACVGSVIPTKGAIIPAAVGVDIGCGMIAVKTKFTDKELPTSLDHFRSEIERRIPLGAGGLNSKIHDTAIEKLKSLASPIDYSQFANWEKQLGSLGSGNHFIEICLDETNQVWIVLHSGSRGVGNQLAQKHIKIAQKLMEQYHIDLTDKDLSYLPEQTQEFNDYIRDLLWAQKFALLNREEMMDRVLMEFSYQFYKENGHQKEIELERINCHHNFTQQENHFDENLWITRKGAIQMRQGQKGIIPGSMGTRSYIVSGLQNDLSFHSAPHGAGRRMSRTAARKLFSLKDLEKVMGSIVFRHSESLIDEIPMAYKDIDETMEYSKELVRIDHTLRQIINIKGD